MLTLRLFGTSVKAKAAFLVPVVGLWGGVTWVGGRRHPGRGFGPVLRKLL